MDRPAPSSVDLDAVAAPGAASGVTWFLEGSDELHVSLVELAAGDSIADHVNAEVDVVVVVLDGAGTLHVDGTVHSLGAHRLVFVPRGAIRGIRSATTPLRYLSIHRDRAPLAIRPRDASRHSSGGAGPHVEEGGDAPCWAHLLDDDGSCST